MNLRCIIILAFVCLGLPTQAQLKQLDVRMHHLTLPEQSLQFQVVTEQLTVKPVQELVYYWVRAGRLHHSRGGYEGLLLHGQFTSFYVSHQLRSKGEFKKGLKTKTWKTWFENGELQTVGEWKNGYRHGQLLTYDEDGKLLSEEHYRNGFLHGEVKRYENGELLVTESYKKGTLIVPEPVAPPDTVSEERKLLEMITPEETPQDTVETEKPERLRWLKNLLPKRKAKESEESPENLEEETDA